MYKSLFALENDDTMNAAPEMETSVEEGEAAGAMTDVYEDSGEIEEMGDAVSDGTEAAGQMEQVEDLVTDVAENGEGLDPVAAEAIRISVEAICARIGANPKAVYSLYATENFASPSSRKANTRIALEGIGEFLKDLYAKIKAALNKMWEKIKAFWAKHISTLGRVKKALESMKTKVSESSGKFKDKADMDDAPSSMIDAFPGKGPITSASVTAVVLTHTTVTGTVGTILTDIAETNKTASNKFLYPGSAGTYARSAAETLKNKKLGTKEAPMVGGVYITYEAESDNETGSVVFTTNKEVLDDTDSKRSIIMGSKDALKPILANTLTIINETIKIKDKADKSEEANKKLMDAFGKAINDKVDTKTKEQLENVRAQLKIANSYSTKSGAINVEILGYNIRLAKAVLGFSALSLKNFKSAA